MRPRKTPLPFCRDHNYSMSGQARREDRTHAPCRDVSPYERGSIRSLRSTSRHLLCLMLAHTPRTKTKHPDDVRLPIPLRLSYSLWPVGTAHLTKRFGDRDTAQRDYAQGSGIVSLGLPKHYVGQTLHGPGAARCGCRWTHGMIYCIAIPDADA
ncbi:hypothetical protein BDW22DRAFT_465970 [Trametopsis cervina]|nr:hypothetical protein BDW22DRAFT_465970 [Trametopsis cervina]